MYFKGLSYGQVEAKILKNPRGESFAILWFD